MQELSQQQIQVVESKVSLLCNRANGFVVGNEDDVNLASEFLKRIRDTEKKIEKKRLEFTQPLNQSLKAINATFKKLIEPLSGARKILSDKVLMWRKKEEEKARIEEEKRRKAEEEKIRKIREAEIEEAKKEEMIEKVIETEIEKVIETEKAKPAIEKPQATIGKTQARKVWAFEVVDFSQVPDKYKMINQVEINADIRAGERKIAGLKIYQKEILSIRS